MKVYTSVKTNYQADMFSVDDPFNDDAVLTFNSRISFSLTSNFGTTLTVFTKKPLPVRWVLQNFTDPFGNVLLGDASGINAAWRITASSPIPNGFTGVEFYRQSLVRI